MGAKLDFNIVCTELINIEDIFKYCFNATDFYINSIETIDSWEWKNHQTNVSLNDISNLLKNRQIVMIYASCSNYKDIGVFIEKIQDSYIYSLWIDTALNSQLEIDVDTRQINWVEFICQNIIGKYKQYFKFLSVGVETIIKYNGSLMDIITNSYNVVIWIVGKESIYEIDNRKFSVENFRDIAYRIKPRQGD